MEKYSGIDLTFKTKEFVEGRKKRTTTKVAKDKSCLRASHTKR